MTAFREPKCYEMCMNGDFRRFLWVMEPTKGQIFGKAFKVDIFAGDIEIEKAKISAYNDMLARVGRDEFSMPEGSVWERFL